MKKFFDMTFGFAAVIAFLAAGIAIVVWDVGMLLQVGETRHWPQTEAVVVRSDIDKSHGEWKPVVEFAYTVEGKSYVSRQISFDWFDKPGGHGSIETIVGRYPIGQKTTAYYDRDEPTTAILEPEVYSPFLMPLVFGALFLFGGAYLAWFVVRQNVLGRPLPKVSTTTRQQFTTAIVSLLIYTAITVVSFDGAVREKHLQAFGERPAGISNALFVVVLQTILYLPMPWVFWHLMQLAFQAQGDGRPFRLGYLLTVGNARPPLRWSQYVCIGGLVYFILICIGFSWMADRGG